MALGLAQRKANDEAQPDLERIEQEAERLDGLIGQIMTLARLRTQKEPVREPVRMDVLVRGIVDDARYEHPEATRQPALPRSAGSIRRSAGDRQRSGKCGS